MRAAVSLAASLIAVGSLTATLTAVGDAEAAKIGVFDDAAFVDTTSGGFAAESDNIQGTLANLGHEVFTLSGTDGEALALALGEIDALVIPELENSDLVSALDSLARAVLTDFIAKGGGLLVGSTSDDRATDLLNGLFGWSLTFGATGPADLSLAAVGTAFEGGPPILADNDRSRGLDVASLPTDVVVPYVNGTRSPLVRLAYGGGRVVYLGWDWYNALPVGAQDGGWFDVLARAVIDATACQAAGEDSDADGIIDACDTVSGCADVDGQRALGTGSRVVLKNLQGDGTAAALALTADLFLPPGSDFSLLDPRLVAVRLVIRAADGIARTVEQLPLAAYDRTGRVGWRFKPRAKKWVFRDRSGFVTNGFRTVVLKDFRGRVERRVRVIASAKSGVFAVTADDLPMGLMVVVGDAAVGECGETAFPSTACAPSLTGGRIKCRLK